MEGVKQLTASDTGDHPEETEKAGCTQMWNYLNELEQDKLKAVLHMEIKLDKKNKIEQVGYSYCITSWDASVNNKELNSSDCVLYKYLLKKESSKDIQYKFALFMIHLSYIFGFGVYTHIIIHTHTSMAWLDIV